MQVKKFGRTAPFAALVFSAILYLLFEFGLMGNETLFASLSIILVAYLFAEIVNLHQVHPERWMINPVITGSVMTFLLTYGVTNFIMFMPADLQATVGITPGITPAMSKHLMLALIGAVAMWIGYWSGFAERLTHPGILRRIQNTSVMRRTKVRPLTFVLLIGISTAARLYQLRMGIFGYTSEYDQLIAQGSITQYLSLAVNCGSVALVLAALQYFSNLYQRSNAIWLIVILASETIWGLLGGFKSAVIFPTLIAIMCHYLVTGKLNKALILTAIFGLVFAYTVIEPFRDQANRYGSYYRDNSLGKIVEALQVGSGESENKSQNVPVFYSISSRLNMTYIGSYGIDYFDQPALAIDDEPAFLGDIILAPAHAWVPRFIWKSKPLGNLGLWYNRQVLGLDNYSSAGMGPITYLYGAGGVFAICIGFFFVGLMQRLLFFYFSPWKSLPGAVIFLGMLSTFTLIDSAFNGIIVNLFRLLPILIFIQFLLLGKTKTRLKPGLV